MISPLTLVVPESTIDLFTDKVLQRYAVAPVAQEPSPELLSLTADKLFPHGIIDESMAASCVSGVWLLHGFLDRSHEISQTIHSREGSFWHAIMHRLEGDFWNSKHWYQKVGVHPVFGLMSKDATWDPFEFVDRCEALKESGDASSPDIQFTAIREWQTLFEYCYGKASD